MTSKDKAISSNYVQVEGLKIHYLTAGEGEPVVLLHGWPTSSYLWRKIMAPLANTSRVIAPDLAGYGQSDKPLSAPYTLNYHVKILNSFLGALDVNRTALAVHDIGGPVGLLWAVRNPQKVQQMVIMDTFVNPDLSFLMKLLLLAARVPVISNLIVSPSGIAMIMKNGVVNKKELTKDVIAAYQAPFANSDARKVLLKGLTSFQPEHLKEIADKLKTLSSPALIIYGEKDILIPSIASEMHRLKVFLPHARIIAIPDCGHFLQEDQPERLSELMIEFFEAGKQA